jgi:hypothetical protein
VMSIVLQGLLSNSFIFQMDLDSQKSSWHNRRERCDSLTWFPP